MALPLWVNNLEDKFPLLKVAINFGRRASKIREFLVFNSNRKKRLNGITHKKYERIKELKGKYTGRRCFIVATGPSLTLDDLQLIKHEYSFGVNSIVRLYNKTDWRPNFYGIQDRHVFNAMLDCVFDQDPDILIFTADILEECSPIPERCIEFPYNDAYHYINTRRFDNYYALFSGDSYDVVYDGYSITYSMIEIAVYMGFKEIYLLGTDCNYGLTQNHIVESGFIDKKAYLNYERMTAGYKAAKEYAEKNNISIVNCTRGGMLEVFPRKTLEEVLEEK